MEKSTSAEGQQLEPFVSLDLLFSLPMYDCQF